MKINSLILLFSVALICQCFHEFENVKDKDIPSKFNFQDLNLIFIGFFKELGYEGLNVNNSILCLENIPDIEMNLIKIITEIKEADFRNISSLIQILKDLEQFMIQVYKENIECFRSLKEISYMLEELLKIGPIQLIERIAFNIVKNLKDITHELEQIIDYLRSRKYEELGKNLANLLTDFILKVSSESLVLIHEDLYSYVKILNGNSIIDIPSIGFNPDDMEQIILGILNGMTVNITGNISNCLNESTKAFDNLIDIIERIIHLEFKNYTQILELLQDMKNIIVDVLHSIKPCTKSREDLEWVIKKIEETSFKTLIERLAKYSVYITADLVAAGKDFLLKKYFQCGRDLGQIMFYLYIKS